MVKYKLQDGEIIKLAHLIKVSEIIEIFGKNAPSKRTIYRILGDHNIKPTKARNALILDVASRIDTPHLSMKDLKELAKENVGLAGDEMVAKLKIKIRDYEDKYNGS